MASEGPGQPTYPFSPIGPFFVRRHQLQCPMILQTGYAGSDQTARKTWHKSLSSPHLQNAMSSFLVAFKRFLTVWKRSVSTTLKRSFTVLANQIIVSETFQAFQILTNHISVRKTLSWKPCLVSNVLAFAELANQNPADSIYFTSFFFFFFFFFFPISLNYNCYKINKNNSQIILWRRVSDAINRKCVLTDSDSGRTL